LSDPAGPHKGLQTATEDGNTDAKNDLGKLLYESGDVTGARAWHQKAADRANDEAFFQRAEERLTGKPGRAFKRKVPPWLRRLRRVFTVPRTSKSLRLGASTVDLFYLTIDKRATRPNLVKYAFL
jgi:hypothetical protein